MAHKISTDCIECGSCVATCPVDAIKEGSPYVIDAQTCTDCDACTSVCPVNAITA